MRALFTLDPHEGGMLPSPDCVPCLLKRVVFQARLAGNGSEMSAVEAAVKVYADGLGRATNSAKLSTQVHSAAYVAMGVRDPYAEAKIRSDEAAKVFFGRAEAFIEASDDRFAAAVRVCIVGNIMDFGTGIAIDDPDQFAQVFDSLLAQGIESDDTAVLKEVVERCSTVVYAFDNCGEDVFDVPFIRILRAMGKRVVGVVRGEPILNDVTREDAVRIGLDRELDLLLDTGAFAVGIDLDRIGDDLRRELSGDAMLIAKGMANFEALEGEDLGIPVAHLLRAKCGPVARATGVPVGTNVVRVRL